MVAKQNIPLKRKKQDVSWERGRKQVSRVCEAMAGPSIWQAGRNRTGKFPTTEAAHIERLRRQLTFGFHVVSEELHVSYAFHMLVIWLIRPSQAVHFPDRPCEKEYTRKTVWSRRERTVGCLQIVIHTFFFGRDPNLYSSTLLPEIQTISQPSL